MTDPRTPTPAVPTATIAGVEVAALTRDQAVDAVLGLQPSGAPQLVVTPNVDHFVNLERDREFAAAYESAALRFADGIPIVALSRLLGDPVPQRVTGIDLTTALLSACERERRTVYFFGGEPKTLERAIARTRDAHPDLAVVGYAAPTVDLNAPTDDERTALEACRKAAPDLVFVFLGAPKQEKWFARRSSQLPPSVVLAVGGTVDFLAGTKRRAPRWVQSIGCEWLWRLGLEPRRLFRRYVVRDSRFVVLAARSLWHQRLQSVSPRRNGRDAHR